MDGLYCRLVGNTLELACTIYRGSLVGRTVWRRISAIQTRGSEIHWSPPHKSRLTQRAPDGWESPRFRAVCIAWNWFRQIGVASSRPPVPRRGITHTVRRRIPPHSLPLDPFGGIEGGHRIVEAHFHQTDR